MANQEGDGVFTPVLEDDFSNGYLTSKWGSPYNGGTYWNGGFEWSADDVKAENGELLVTSTRHADGSWTAGGFSSFKAGNTITYGTVEFDARVEQAQGTQAAILMWPASDVWPRDGEIDILETPRTVPMHSTHWEGSDGSHQSDSIFSDYDPGQTHHYKMTWLPSILTIEVDGQIVASWTDPDAIPDTAMGFGAMGYVAVNGEEWLGGGPDWSTPDVVTTHIDNVVMSQWTGGSGEYNGGGPVTPAPEPTPEPTPEPSEPVTTPGTEAPAAQFGGRAEEVWVGDTDFGGSSYVTFGGKSEWGSGPGAKLVADSWGASWSTKLAFDNFVQTNIDLSKLSDIDMDLMLVSAKRGSVSLGDGDDQVTWVAHSNASTHGNTMTIKTGAGDDTVTITDAGRSSLADYDRYDNGTMYNAEYDGQLSAANVTFDSGNDSVTVEGLTQLLLQAGSGQATAIGGEGNDVFNAGTGTADFTGGAGKDSFVFAPGNGHAVIQDFIVGEDTLRFGGSLTQDDLITAAATEGGIDGLLVTYGDAGSSVFLAHVSEIAEADMLFA